MINMKTMSSRRIVTTIVLVCSTMLASIRAASVEPPGQASALLARAVGEWRWTTQGRNGQPEETVLKLVAAPNGAVSGVLTDRAGTHPFSNVVLKGSDLEFAVTRDTPNGKVSLGYVLSLDDKHPKIRIERPDFAPSAKKTGKKRMREATVTRIKDDTPKNAK